MFFCPENKFRAIIFTIIKHKIFDPLILVIIIANIVTMAMFIEDSSLTYQDTLTTLNTAFTFCFITEAGLKILALGP